MRTDPVEHKFGKPQPYPVSFGIFKEMRKTAYGVGLRDNTKGITSKFTPIKPIMQNSFMFRTNVESG